MKNLAAVIDSVEYLNPKSVTYIVWVYDKDRPRMPEEEDPHARYACIDMLGPFNTLDHARRACEAAGIGG